MSNVFSFISSQNGTIVAWSCRHKHVLIRKNVETHVVCDIISRGTLLSLESGFMFSVVVSVSGAKKQSKLRQCDVGWVELNTWQPLN